MEKINLVEILKNCPRGMELNCVAYDNVSFDKISDDKKTPYPIFCYITDEEGNRSSISFTEDGYESKRYGAKCIIFPKGKNSWKGFVPPPKFKAGDVIISEAGNIVLFSHIDSENVVYYHCIIPTYSNLRIEETAKVGVGKYYECTLADAQQRQRMYDSIKRSGYKYNQNTNKLEKLIKPKFKIGDKIVNDNYVVEITDIFTDDQVYGYKSKMGGIGGILFTEQDDWELVPDKFDVTTLKPFDKVLVRDSIFGRWKIQFFEKFDKELKYPFVCMNGRYSICIPYNGNEYLHDTINPCDDYYKI
jgi:hypothetical protein